MPLPPPKAGAAKTLSNIFDASAAIFRVRIFCPEKNQLPPNSEATPIHPRFLADPKTFCTFADGGSPLFASTPLRSCADSEVGITLYI